MIRNIENLNKLNNDRYDYSKISGKNEKQNRPWLWYC